MYVATASPRPKRTAFDGSRGGGGGGGGGMCPVFPPPPPPPLDPPLVPTLAFIQGS